MQGELDFNTTVDGVATTQAKELDRELLSIAVSELLKKMPKGDLTLSKFLDGAIKVSFVKREEGNRQTKFAELASTNHDETGIKSLILSVLKIQENNDGR